MRKVPVVATALLAVLTLSPVVAASSLIKGSGAAVYFLSSNGKRYVFPNQKTYDSWYADFKGVTTVTDAQLAATPIGGNVTYKPGSRLVKIQTDPKVYAVDANGTLRWVKTEAVAKALYGADWNKKVDDVPDAFFTDYKTGADVASSADFVIASVEAKATSIDADKGLATATAAIDPTKLPLGDQKYSTAPKKGYIYSCQTSFTTGNAGAFADGPWIHGTTWDETTKVAVSGKVSWPSATYGAATSGATRTITANGLPKGYTTGTFPIASSDKAYSYDRNPNHVGAQSYALALPANPTFAASPTCVGMGMIGISTDGVAVYNGFDAGGRDAEAHEIQDSCGGHPDQSSTYHYHGLSPCLDKGTGQSVLIGYALDGFGIYGPRDANGHELTSADLDECHGTTSAVLWDGKMTVMYHYVATHDFPYTIGCYKGTPISAPKPTGGSSAPTGGTPSYPPPPPPGYYSGPLGIITHGGTYTPARHITTKN